MKIRIEPWCFYFWALLVLVLPLPWLLAAAAAAGVHELCHWAAVKALGGQVLWVDLGAVGASMEAALPGTGRQVLAILAGPAGSLALLAAAGEWPRLALCALAQGLFNLLPVRGLDGGRALALVLERWCPAWSGAILIGLEWGVFWAAASISLRLWGIGGLVAAALAALWQMGRNTSCKRGRFRVQCSCCTQKEGTL